MVQVGTLQKDIQHTNWMTCVGVLVYLVADSELMWKNLSVLAKENSQHIIDLINNSYIYSFNKYLKRSYHLGQHARDLLHARQKSPRRTTFCLVGFLGREQEQKEDIREQSLRDVAKLYTHFHHFKLYPVF